MSPGQMSPGNRHVVVVGAGLAGLSAAMHLRAAGHEVTVLDQEPVAGGRLGLLIEHGSAGTYRFDTGPSTFGLPALVEECFRALGRPMADYLQLTAVRPGLVAHFPDGDSLQLDPEPDALAAEVERFAGGADAAGLLRFTHDLTVAARELRGLLDQPSTDSPVGLARRAWRRIEVARSAPRIQNYVTDLRLHQLYRWSPVPGRWPESAWGVLGTYADLVAPAWFPRGGMFRLPASMAAAAQDAGVRLRYRTEVTGTRSDRRKVTTVLTGDGELACDELVLTTTRPTAFRLLDTEREFRGTFAPSAWMLLAGGSIAPPAPAGHRSVFFGRDDPTDALDTGRLPRDPTLLVTTPSKTDASLAPRGRATAAILTPAPYLGPHPLAGHAPAEPLIPSSQDWGRIGGHYLTHIVKMLQANGFRGLHALDVEHVLTPVDWLARGLERGTPHGMHQFSRSNRVRDNVTLAGAALGQGSDVAQALVSGMQAADRITGRPRQRTDWTQA